MTTDIRESAGNAKKLGELNQAFTKIVNEATQRGFHGKVYIGVKVQDGTIQEIVRTIKRVDR